MKSHLKVFLIPYILLLIVGFVVYFLGQHGDFVIWLNTHHSPFFDFLFKYGTYFGDGVFLGIVALLLIIFKRRYGLILALLGVVQAIVSAILKKVVFGKVPRPKKYFDDITQFHQVEGVDLNGWFSFPSGHTMTAFSIAAFLCLTFKNAKLSLLFFLFAIVGGLSRVYLLQHFLIDVLVGSLIGVILALALEKLFRNYLEPDLE